MGWLGLARVAMGAARGPMGRLGSFMGTWLGRDEGGGCRYDSQCRTLNEFVRTHDDFLSVTAAGNYGPVAY